MNEFEILAAFVRIFEKGVSQTLLRLRHFDQQFSRMQAGWRQVNIGVGVPGLQQVQTQLTGVNQQLSQMKRETERVTGGFEAMRRVVFAIRGILAGAVVGFIARVTTEFEKLNLRLLAFTQNQRVATQLFRDLLQFSSRTFFDISELADSAAQLLNMRVAVESIIPSLRVLNDIAIATGRSIADISFPLLDIAQKQHATQRDLIQFNIRSLNIYNALSRVTGIWGNELEEAVTKGKIGFKEVTEALKLMAKEMSVGAAAANTQTAKFKRLWNEIKIGAFEISKAMEPLTSRVLDGLTKTAEGAIAAAEGIKEYEKAWNDFYGTAAEKQPETTLGRLNSLFTARAPKVFREFNDNIKKEMEQGWSRHEAVFKTIEKFLNTGFKEVGKESGEAFARGAEDGIAQGMEDIDFFEELGKQSKEANKRLRSDLVELVTEVGREQVTRILQFPFDFQTGRFGEEIRDVFDQARRETLIFVGEWMQIFEEFQPRFGERIASQIATAEIAFRDVTRLAEQAGEQFGRLVTDVQKRLKPEETRKIEAFGKAFAKAMEDGGISLGATVESFFKKDGPVDQAIEGVTKQVLELFKIAELPTAGGLAGAFKAGSVEALQLRKAGLDFDKRQLETLNRIEANTRKQTEKFDPVDVLVNFIGGGIFQGAGG